MLEMNFITKGVSTVFAENFIFEKNPKKTLFTVKTRKTQKIVFSYILYMKSRKPAKFTFLPENQPIIFLHFLVERIALPIGNLLVSFKIHFSFTIKRSNVCNLILCIWRCNLKVVLIAFIVGSFNNINDCTLNSLIRVTNGSSVEACND